MDTAGADDAVVPVTATEPAVGRHPDIPTIGPIAGSYRWNVATDRWWWSDEIYVIHGFAAGQVVPTTALFLSHKHPEDRARAENTISTALERGGRFSCYHRIFDAAKKERQVLVVGGARTEADGRVVELFGFMVDLTQARRDDFQPAIEQAIQAAVAHRTAIDMAKGAIMLGYGVDADTAFDILRSASNSSNLKLHDLARGVVDALGRTAPDTAAAQRLDGVLRRAAGAERTVSPQKTETDPGERA